MLEKRYYVSRCVRCGDMPLFLIFYHDKHGHYGQCAMLCSFRKVKLLMREKKGFADPSQFGHVIFNSPHHDASGEALVEMLKQRYDFDLTSPDIQEIKLFFG